MAYSSLFLKTYSKQPTDWLGPGAVVCQHLFLRSSVAKCTCAPACSISFQSFIAHINTVKALKSPN